MKRLQILKNTAWTILTMLALPLVQSCFTGVESTPRITSKAVRKSKVEVTPEMRLMAGVSGENPLDWRPGKTFYVTDNRILRVMQLPAPNYSSTLSGQYLTLNSLSYVPSITGQYELQLTLRTTAGDSLRYRTGLTREALDTLSTIAVPYTVEESLIRAADSLLAGNTYYILPPRRLDQNGVTVMGLRYVPVKISRVTAGDERYPLRIYFTEKADTAGGRTPQEQSLMMTVGNGPAATRNFNTLFSIDNPRLKYPDITDEVWRLIMLSRIRLGMTPQECRLALGSPEEFSQIPTTAGMVDRWRYSNGMFLIFEDGVLSQFRL